MSWICLIVASRDIASNVPKKASAAQGTSPFFLLRASHQTPVEAASRLKKLSHLLQDSMIWTTHLKTFLGPFIKRPSRGMT